MSEPTVDVLAVIDFHLSQLCVETPEDQEHYNSMVKAIAAVAELVEADRYYDDAQFGLARAKYNGEPVESWAQDVLKAEVRRAAALARVGGAS